MDDVDVKMFNNIPNEKAFHKSAIIYRDDSARFIYVCFHCGRLFNEINETLHHIETHFQLANVTVEPFVENDNKEVLFIDNFPVEPIDSIAIKFEKPEPEAATSEPPKRKTKKPSTDADGKRAKSGNKELPYRCHKCPKAAKNLARLRTHLQKYSTKELLKVYKCNVCDEYFRNAPSLRVHVLGAHLKEMELKCPVCAAQFKSTESKRLAQHLQRHKRSDDKMLVGLSDPKTDYSKYEQIDVFTELPYCCEYCDLSFYIESNLDMHVQRKHHSPRQLQCIQCNATFAALKHYYAHQLEHQRVGPTITETDEKVLLANLDVRIEERMIIGDGSNGEPRFRCLACGVSSDLSHVVRSHVRKVHVYKTFPPPFEIKTKYICDYCGMMLKSRDAMAKHFMIHTGTKLHACTMCGKTFRLDSDRKIHERSHTGEKPYQCHECGKAFVSNGHLTAHKKRHEDTTYPCEICGKTFNLPSGYRNHIKTHRPDRPFVCGVCGKSFNTKLYLRRHEVIHSNKMYKCKFCDREFNTCAGRRQHHRHMHKFEANLLTQQ